MPPKPNEFDSAYLNRGRALDVRDVVEIALRIGRLVVDRGRNHLMPDREHGDAGFEAAGGAEQVPGHRLGRRDGELPRVIAEDAA